MPTLKVKKLQPDAILPKYQTAGAACFDLHVCQIPADRAISLARGPKVFDTGLAFEVPEGFGMLIYSRSGHGFKNGVRLANCVGVIDSDYRGSLRVKLTADGNGGLVVHNGDRIAQAMLVPVQQWTITETDALNETERGDNGYGSTGA